MQDMRSTSPALGERGASVSRITGKAVCCNCGGETFEIVIYNDGTTDAVCAFSRCRTFWSPLGQGQGSIAHLSPAMGNGGDVAVDVVSEAEEEYRKAGGTL